MCCSKTANALTLYSTWATGSTSKPAKKIIVEWQDVYINLHQVHKYLGVFMSIFYSICVSAKCQMVKTNLKLVIFSFSFILFFYLQLSWLCSYFRNICFLTLSWDELVIFLRHTAFLSFYSLWDDMICWLQGFIWNSLAPLMLAVSWEYLEADHVHPTHFCSCRPSKQHKLVPAPQSV